MAIWNKETMIWGKVMYFVPSYFSISGLTKALNREERLNIFTWNFGC